MLQTPHASPELSNLIPDPQSTFLREGDKTVWDSSYILPAFAMSVHLSPISSCVILKSLYSHIRPIISCYFPMLSLLGP